MSLQKNILAPAVAQLKQANKDTPALDARLLLSDALGIKAEELLLKSSASAEGVKKFESHLARRLKGEPVSRIVGKRDFWHASFLLAPEVFDPRADTETLVALALEEQGEPLHLLDLGTGSGCILLSLLAQRSLWRGVGLDISPDAVALARTNARREALSARVHFLCGDWRVGFSGDFDLITCNPPYIKAGEIGTLAAEVKDFDPLLALSGGDDGLAAYRELAVLVPALLKKKGILLLELGAGQAEAVGALFDRELFRQSFHPDLAGITRVLRLEKLF